MPIKLLQLNIFQGKFLPQIIEFVNENNIDILHLQEVSSGKMSRGGKYKYPRKMKLTNETSVNEDSIGIDCFEELKKGLNMKGERVATYGYVDSPESTEGNATLFKNDLKLLDKDIVWLKDYMEIKEGFTDVATLSRAALITKLEIDGKTLTTINVHMAWGPDDRDEPYKIEQAQKLFEYIKNISKPFVFTGDFNVSPDTRTASMFNDLAKNLTLENNIKNTLNSRIHPAPVFPPGLAVDQVFISSDIKVNSFTVLDSDLSDHLGLLLEFEL